MKNSNMSYFQFILTEVLHFTQDNQMFIRERGIIPSPETTHLEAKILSFSQVGGDLETNTILLISYPRRGSSIKHVHKPCNTETSNLDRIFCSLKSSCCALIISAGSNSTENMQESKSETCQGSGANIVLEAVLSNFSSRNTNSFKLRSRYV